MCESEYGTNEYFTYNNHGDVTSYKGDGYDYDAFGKQIDDETDATYNPFRYCGEYFDEETGFVYLRARYYDPGTQRFVTEDPAFDGTNWYSYCGNNPVNFRDPSGLSITIKGKAEGIDDARFEALKKLTRDELHIDEKNGNITYTRNDDSNDLEVGTNLVREIVDNEKTNCDIVFTSEGNKIIYHTGIDKETDVSYTIEFNPNSSTILLTQNSFDSPSELTDRPSYIALGHELIHAVRGMQHIYYDDSKTALYYYVDTDGGKKAEMCSPEELSTTGINYFKYNGKKSFNSVSTVFASAFYYTENALRKEHGLPMRIRYYYD